MRCELYEEIEMAKDVRSYMTSYIREHFAQMLGEHVRLLDAPDGLDRIQDMIKAGQIVGY